MDIDEAGIETDFEIKTYYPQYAEFKNMKSFIEFLEKDSLNRNGLCKVSKLKKQ